MAQHLGSRGAGGTQLLRKTRARALDAGGCDGAVRWARAGVRWEGGRSGTGEAWM